MMEILPSGASQSGRSDQRSESLQCLVALPGEIREENDVERQAAATDDVTGTCMVWNDLRVAAEVEFGSHGRIIYPGADLELAVDSKGGQPLPLSVRLRDDLNIWGICTAVPGSTFRLSSSFGDFGDRATKHFQEEETAAEEESRLRKQRQKELDKKLGAEVTSAILQKQKCTMIFFFLCLLIFFTAMISCAVASFILVTELQGFALAAGLLMLWACAGCAGVGLGAAAGGGAILGSFAAELRGSVRATRPELQRYQDEGVEAEGDWRDTVSTNCLAFIPLVSFCCMVAMSVSFRLIGHDWLLAVVWGPVAMLSCCGGVLGWIFADGGWEQRATSALMFVSFAPLLWPVLLLRTCGLQSGIAAFLLKPPKRSLDAAVHTTHEHTIVFEGNVLANCETVCSWPGKYATAWDNLVVSSRQDDISAAVVFLPEGSEHYGFHDPIPGKHDLRDLHGECWCTPLYGECKPWGCRWWSKWIANIEQAVSQECTLVVYYFDGMRGKGKVKDFTTAGEENMRREAIFRCKDAFLKSDIFQDALEGGLKHLPKEQGPDSSSPYSREVHRLFLATLPEEDCWFLEASEGLGNSQKAEVAWLERNGYQYIEKEVREFESSSPKAIGRATE